MTPDAGAVHLTVGRGDHRGRDAVDGSQDIALTDACLVRGGAGGNDVRPQATVGFDPARAVCGSGVGALLDEIGDGESNGAQRHDGKQDCQQTGLGAASHRDTLGYLRNRFLSVEQVNCQIGYEELTA